jgi:hypothetical protein
VSIGKAHSFAILEDEDLSASGLLEFSTTWRQLKIGFRFPPGCAQTNDSPILGK